MPIASLIALIVVIFTGVLVIAAGGVAFKDGFTTYLGINEVIFSFSIIIGIAVIGFGIIGIIGNQRKKLNLLALSSFALQLLFVGVLGMAVYIFVARSNYLPNDPDGPPLPDCHQEYESFNDLVHTYQQVGTFFCKQGCPCNYKGTYTNPDMRTNQYGSIATQQCFQFRNLPNLNRAAALLKHVEQTYLCSGLCSQVFPIYYFSDVNTQEGPVTLRCDGKLRLFVDQSSLTIAGLMCSAALGLFLSLLVIISNFCHPGFYVIFPNEVKFKIESEGSTMREKDELADLKRTPSFEIVATETDARSSLSRRTQYNIQTFSDKSGQSFD